MDDGSTVTVKRSWAKIAGVAVLVYLVSFGVFLALDDAGVLPRPCRDLYVIYYPLIRTYMAALFPH